MIAEEMQIHAWSRTEWPFVQQRLGDTSLNGVTCLAALWSHWGFFLTCRYSIQGKKRKQQMHLDSEISSLSLQQVCWVEATIDVLGFFLRSVDILGSN